MQLYYLMHKDIEVAKLEFDEEYQIKRCSISNAEHMPNLINTRQLLVENYALSLSDCYWICPADKKITWDYINLYSNEAVTRFFDQKDVLFSGNASLGGNIPKEWSRNAAGEWIIRKYSEEGKQTQAINETFASNISSRQNIFQKKSIAYVDYSLPDDDPGVCECPSFASENMEYISAYECVGHKKIDNDTSVLEAFVRVCEENGLNKHAVIDHIDYQILLDFVILNTDRHLNNFGILRNPDTLEFISMAPIFDNGNSMSYNEMFKHNRLTSLQQRLTGLYDKQEKMLSKVTDRAILDSSLLPSADEVTEKYIHYGLEDADAERIAHNYSIRCELLDDFQNGENPSIYSEKLKQRKHKKSEI